MDYACLMICEGKKQLAAGLEHGTPLRVQKRLGHVDEDARDVSYDEEEGNDWRIGADFGEEPADFDEPV
jgi:hypothetical protein